MKNKGVYIFNLILFLYIIILKFLVLNHFSNYYKVVNAIFWIISLIVIGKLLGIKKDNSIVKSNVTQITIIVIIIYVFLSTLSGLIFGFLKNSYSLSISSIIKNIYSLAIMIVAEEYIRGAITNSCVKDTKPLLILTILYILLDLVLVFGAENVSSLYKLFIFISTIGLPIVARNILCTYLTYNISKVPGMILRLFFSLYIYIFPLFPDLGDYLNSIIGLIIPYLIYFLTSGIINKALDKRVKPIRKNLWYLDIPLIIALLFLISLVTGLFKYQIMAIGSGSMEPLIYRGDAVIFEKIKTEEEKLNLKEEMIIVFEHDGMYVTHRIVSIEDVNGMRVYQTKGDNNKSNDNFKVYDKDIVGITKMRVKFVGLPTVWIQDLLNR